MNNTRKIILLGITLLLGACAEPALRAGNGELSAEGLQRLSGTAFDEVWARPGVDLRQFQALALEQVNVAFREAEHGVRERPSLPRTRQTEFEISEQERDRIEQRFQRRLAEALGASEAFRFSSEAAPGALLMRATLTDYVSRVPPETVAGRSQVWVSSVGEATLVVELWDPQRGELLVRAIDHQKMEPAGSRLIRGDSVTSVAEVDRQMQRWARDVRQVVDQLNQLGGTATLGGVANGR